MYQTEVYYTSSVALLHHKYDCVSQNNCVPAWHSNQYKIVLDLKKIIPGISDLFVMLDMEVIKCISL